MIKLGVIVGPFPCSPWPDLKINGLMAVVKPNGNIRPCVNLSALAKVSFNDGIDKSELFCAQMDVTASVLIALHLAGEAVGFSRKT